VAALPRKDGRSRISKICPDWGGGILSEEETDYDYYRRRAAEEMEKARSATDLGLAAKHRQLSTIYTSRALQAERKQEVDGRAGDAAPSENRAG
jgi:hypothetical protein